MKTNQHVINGVLLGLCGVLLAPGMVKAHPHNVQVQDTAGFREFVAAHAVKCPAAAVAPSGTVRVPEGTVSSVLLQSTGRDGDVLLRITSGALRGSLVKASFCDNQWVFIKVEDIRTASGGKVWMPMCKCVDADGEVDVPRVQVDRSEWNQVRRGGIAEAGETFHLRVLAPLAIENETGLGDRVLAQD
jgi:hypothetical protein